MKKLFIALLLLTLSSCTLPSVNSNSSNDNSSNSSGGNDGNNNNNNNNNQNSNNYISNLPFSIAGASNGGEAVTLDNIQNSAILHAWGWRMSDIMNNLDAIADAGYTAIQTSPMQPSKKPDAYGEWWNLYQPLGFLVNPDEGGQNPLGTKSDLISLCNAAEAKGIKIIVDVVTNHLAQGSIGQLFTQGQSWSGGKSCSDYEDQIVSQNLIHTGYSADNDDNTVDIVKGCLGELPDLKTENSIVQNRVISMLKEYIDCGVKGFRFDAAKHIETPDDGVYASNFWPNVVNAVNSYGQQVYQENPFIYGEILTTPGNNRSWGSYLNYMSLVDNKQGERTIKNISNHNPASARSSYTFTASKVVAWAESHDTWAHPTDGDATIGYSSNVTNLAYAVQASRKGPAPLYFTRPSNGNRDNAKDYPQVNSSPSSDYKSALIKGVNKFHNLMIGADESSNNYDRVGAVIRKSSSNEGAFVYDTDFNSSISSYTLDGLSDGTYTDLITNKNYQVTNSKVNNLTFTNGGAALVKYVSTNGSDSRPYISFNVPNVVFTGTTDITINVSNGTENYVKYNDRGWVKFDDSITLRLGAGMNDGSFVVRVASRNDHGISAHSITLTKQTVVNYEDDVTLLNVPTSDNVYAWVWAGEGQGHWEALTRKGTNLVYNVKGDEDHIIFAKFQAGVVPSGNSWNGMISQTANLLISDAVFEYTL